VIVCSYICYSSLEIFCSALNGHSLPLKYGVSILPSDPTGLQGRMALNGCQSPRKKSSNSVLVIAQVQAFLAAAEDVDIDPETVEDLLQTFSEHQTDDGNAEVQEKAYDSDDDSCTDNRDPDVLDISALFNNREAGKSFIVHSKSMISTND
jgi:hypothetical protein